VELHSYREPGTGAGHAWAMCRQGLQAAGTGNAIRIDGGITMNITEAWHDPIVAEIHAIREQLAEQYQNDLVAYSKTAEEHCRALGLTMTQSPRAHRREARRLG
jgi:hypothetical protein